LSIFSKFHNILKIIPDDYYSQVFVSPDFGNQLKVKPNAVVADYALIQQCAMAHCAGKMMAMLTCEASELIDPYMWPPNRMTF